jgi:uncharacterized protein (DUF433 family)
MMLPAFLEQQAYGQIRVTGHRIDLLHVIEPYKEGCSPEMLAEEYPTLSVELIQRIISFYLENEEEVDAYLARVRGELDRQEAAAPHVDWEELQRRLQARRHDDKA